MAFFIFSSTERGCPSRSPLFIPPTFSGHALWLIRKASSRAPQFSVAIHQRDQIKNIALRTKRHVRAQCRNRKQPPSVFGTTPPTRATKLKSSRCEQNATSARSAEIESTRRPFLEPPIAADKSAF